ncbi:hypothetical protein Hanom_Chr06g00494531 [Helianthus anomalus]
MRYYPDDESMFEPMQVEFVPTSQLPRFLSFTKLYFLFILNKLLFHKKKNNKLERKEHA